MLFLYFFGFYFWLNNFMKKLIEIYLPLLIKKTNFAHAMLFRDLIVLEFFIFIFYLIKDLKIKIYIIFNNYK